MKEVIIRAKYSQSQAKWHLSGSGFERNTYLDNPMRTEEENALTVARHFTYDRHYVETGYEVKNCGDHYMVTIKMIPRKSAEA